MVPFTEKFNQPFALLELFHPGRASSFVSTEIDSYCTGRFDLLFTGVSQQGFMECSLLWHRIPPYSKGNAGCTLHSRMCSEHRSAA